MMEEIKLFAPNGLPIAGALAANGSIREFVYSYDQVTKTRLYELAEGHALPDAQTILVDTQGTKWRAEDVEWHTLFERKK